ncbi:pyridoxal phosphate-dependent aminotransferase [Flavilitoribacter nigricans]|uniref:Aminotransferase n=1 Tax=Flavilitoribacter nigricans (strain ATCC 23147 / DSM 23189 / NBRC 102662 / NCIMB 1420 / SS-2) TaxID=1122177 RepID=A0A2D0MYV2_FLAN2|nr:aminotransferase class I/II-fold pyridoxal phosphate-dependent enzyme [Flavilitoribacter nigricans]PHN01444.1 aminotransferase [Flavilitoribacter nigricans DSM 23189 = NBRC 102662]
MNIQTASRLGQVEEYYFSRKLREIAQMRAEGKDVLNLGIGSPDLPPAPEVIETLHQASSSAGNHGYQSYNGIPELRQAFADWYRNWFEVELDPNTEILPLIGSKEGIMHISMTYLEAGDEVLVPNPGYPTYSAVARLTGASIRHYNLEADKGWFPDLDALGQEDLSKVKIMWINYPNMPTGTPASKEFFSDLVDFARKHEILIINDNPYAFILNDEPLSLLSVPGAMDVAMELNSLSKSHNMAGWRAGMLAGKKEFLQDVLRFKSNMDSGMFRPLQMAAAKALSLPESWYRDLNAVYTGRRSKVFALLDQLGCTYNTDQVGMFVWAETPEQYPDGYALSDEVLEKAHVFITPGGIFGSSGTPYIRVSLCSTEAVFAEALDRIKSAF